MQEVKEKVLTKEDVAKFDWIQLKTDIDNLHVTESRKDKLLRKISENPFVPFGCLATTAALGYGLWSFRQGKRKMAQYMMRTRVVAQALTIFAIMAGLGISASKITETDKKLDS